jgi:cyclophilin family peptidyl-prolyl cis-trans isomerase
MGTDKRARQKEQHRTRVEEARRAAAAAERKKRLVNSSIVAGLLVAVVAVLWWANSSNDTKTAATTTTAADKTTTTAVGQTTTTAATAAAVGTAECPAADGSSKKPESFDGPPKMCIDAAKKYTAKVATNQGDFTIALDPAKAPNTVNNFVFLSRYHFYDGVIFHRIMKDFMFQGGDPTGTGSGGPGYKFADELPKAGEYEKYSVAMANSGPNTNGSQFFVITGAQGVALTPDYSLFGKVTEGTDIADKIGAVETETGDRPKSDVTIKSITITES